MFSVIITLGLLYLIGVAWSKLKDSLNNKSFQLEKEAEEKLKPVLAHLYVLSWKYYQVVEPEVIRYWKQSYAQLYDEHDGLEFYEIAMHLFGRTTQEESIARALKEMQRLKLKLPKHIPKHFNKFFVVEWDHFGYSIDEEADKLCNKLPVLKMEFNHDAAAYAEDPYILSLMPPKRRYRSYHGANR